MIDPDSKIEEVIDLGFVGEPVEVDRTLLDLLARSEMIPVIAPVAPGRDGETYNINADTFAGAIAGALQATRLLFLTDVPGVLDKSGKLIDELTVAEARALIADGTISGGMIPKVETCIEAVGRGVEGVVILNGKTPHAVLLELFTAHGAGTLITGMRRPSSAGTAAASPTCCLRSPGRGSRRRDWPRCGRSRTTCRRQAARPAHRSSVAVPSDGLSRSSIGTTGAGIRARIAAGPWKCAAVAGPLTGRRTRSTRSAPCVSEFQVTSAVPVAAVSTGGTSSAPVRLAMNFVSCAEAMPAGREMPRCVSAAAPLVRNAHMTSSLDDPGLGSKRNRNAPAGARSGKFAAIAFTFPRRACPGARQVLADEVLTAPTYTPPHEYPDRRSNRAAPAADLAAFASIEAWIFDLDNTLYPRSTNLFQQVDERIRTYVGEAAQRRRGGGGAHPEELLPRARHDAARPDAHATMSIPTSSCNSCTTSTTAWCSRTRRSAPRILRLPGKNYIFTNGSRQHAEKVAERLGFPTHFEDIFDIVAADLVPKPEAATYDRFVKRFGIVPQRAAMFEDLSRNLVVPKAVGMTTVLVVPPGTREVFHGEWEFEGRDDEHVDFVTDDLTRFVGQIADAIGV